MKHPLFLVAAAAGASSVAAHGSPSTPAEVEAYQRAQESMYHCAPIIASYTKQRKRSWQQKFLGGAALTHEDLFLDGAFSTLDDAKDEGKKLLECGEVAETVIRNNTCVLSPVVTSGPYYHVSGHPIRQNMAEWQHGLLWYMDIGVIDVETCEPLEGALVDVWHANATGHYAGHPDPAPDLVNEQPQVGGPRSGLLSAFPRTNFHEQWLRAAWPTDRNGVSQFTSIFPGYYTGRATHVHAKIHLDWTANPNGTFYSSRVQYIGQFFVDDDINMEVDKMWPYVTNPIKESRGRTRNWRDSLNIYPDSHKNGFKPTFEIQKLGGVLNQGLIGYMTIGVNKSASYDHTWRG